jgi:hypothetical protein
MSRETEKRLIEWAVWFHENSPRIPKNDLQKRCDFLQKNLDGLYELMTRVCEDLRIAEGRPVSNRLWLPEGVKMTGDVRKFG